MQFFVFLGVAFHALGKKAAKFFTFLFESLYSKIILRKNSGPISNL